MQRGSFEESDMAIKIIDGNLFTTHCQTVVNTVNCVGVMGAGIALECRLRYPMMFYKYARLCEEKRFSPGMLWLYRGNPAEGDVDDRWVLNFPTKIHWKYPSRIEWVRQGLEKFVATYKAHGIESAAFPVLGGLNGGLDEGEVLELMSFMLSPCDIPIEIYKYDPNAADDLYETFKTRFGALSDSLIFKISGIRGKRLSLIREALEDPLVCQLNQLAKKDGIGIKTMEAVFKIVVGEKQSGEQLELFPRDMQ